MSVLFFCPPHEGEEDEEDAVVITDYTEGEKDDSFPEEIPDLPYDG